MTVLTDYFGGNLTRDDYWRLEIDCVHEQHRQDEAELMQGRWFDYRMMPPAQATYLFAAHYAHEYRAIYRRIRDIRTVDSVQPFAPEDIFESRDLVSMWLARREADRIGCTYDFYLRACFVRFADRGWKNIPRPNQLYGEELTLDLRDAWIKRCTEVMQFPTSEFFAANAYIAHPYQDDYHAWVVGQINKRAHKHLALASVLKQGMLSRELAEQHFGADLMRRAMQFVAIT